MTERFCFGEHAESVEMLRFTMMRMKEAGVKVTVETKLEPDGAESLTYMVTVDLEQLKQMARKAAGNKGQVAVDGPLEVAVMSRRRL